MVDVKLSFSPATDRRLREHNVYRIGDEYDLEDVEKVINDLCDLLDDALEEDE